MVLKGAEDGALPPQFGDRAVSLKNFVNCAAESEKIKFWGKCIHWKLVPDDSRVPTCTFWQMMVSGPASPGPWSSCCLLSRAPSAKA